MQPPSASDPRTIGQAGAAPTDPFRKLDERRAFVLLAVFLAPVLAVVLVGSYGFLIWMSQLIFGPPGS